MLVHKQRAIPGWSLFSFNLQTKKTKFVRKEEFTQDEIRQGIQKYYSFFSGVVIYLQEVDLKSAEKKFKKFYRHKYGKQTLN